MARVCKLITLIALMIGCASETQYYPTANRNCVDVTEAYFTDLDGELNLVCKWDCAHPPRLRRRVAGTHDPTPVTLWIGWYDGQTMWRYGNKCNA